MAATTKTRPTSMREGAFITIPVAASTVIHGGSIVASNATGYAVPASADATLFVWGVADTAVDNSAGADGDLSVVVELSAGSKDFLFANAGANSVVQADIGLSCHIEDDQTVSMDATGKPVAGTVMGVSSAGVYVRFAH